MMNIIKPLYVTAHIMKVKPLYVLHDEHYETIIRPTWWTLWNCYMYRLICRSKWRWVINEDVLTKHGSDLTILQSYTCMLLPSIIVKLSSILTWAVLSSSPASGRLVVMARTLWLKLTGILCIGNDSLCERGNFLSHDW